MSQTAANGAATLTIGQVAEAAGLPTSAIRFYEEVGLLPKPARVSGKRRFDPEAVDRLLLIRFGRRLGFRLSDMRGLLFDPRNPKAKTAWRRLVDARLEEVAALIRSAQAVERVLRESRDCDCVTLDSCRFLQEERSPHSRKHPGWQALRFPGRGTSPTRLGRYTSS